MDISILKDKFGIHTFMLTYTKLTFTEYRRLLKLFMSSISDRSDNYSYITTNLLFDNGYYGIYPELYYKCDHRYLCVFVNPRNLLESRLCTYEIMGSDMSVYIEKLVSQIDEALKLIADDYNIYAFENAYLTRVDLCVNYFFDKSYIIGQYIRLAKKSVHINSGRLRGLYIKGRYDEVGNRHHFGLDKYNFELTIYDKSFELMRLEKIPEFDDEFGNVLRIEVKLKRRYIANTLGDLDEPVPSNIDRLLYILSESRFIMIDSLNKVFYSGDYLQRDLLEEVIRNSSFQSHIKEIMVKIISENDNIDNVYDNIAMDYELPKKTIQRLKSKFKKLGVNSTPISTQDSENDELFLPGFANLLMCEDIKQNQDKTSESNEVQ